jgi:hypothetical protein
MLQFCHVLATNHVLFLDKSSFLVQSPWWRWLKICGDWIVNSNAPLTLECPDSMSVSSTDENRMYVPCMDCWQYSSHNTVMVENQGGWEEQESCTWWRYNLIGKSEEKIPHRRCRHWFMGNIVTCGLKAATCPSAGRGSRSAFPWQHEMHRYSGF